MLTEEEKRARHTEYMRRWREKNPDKIKKAKEDHRAKHPRSSWSTEKFAREKALHRQYYLAHIEEVCNYKREFRATDRGRQARREESRKYRNSERGQEVRRRWYRRKRSRLEAMAKPATLHAAAYASIPTAIPSYARDDIAADIMLAVLSGEFALNEIAANAKRYVTAYNRMFSKFGPESLDAARFDDGNSTLHDTVSVGLWD